MSFNNSFVQSFDPSYQQSIRAAAQAQQMKQQAALEEQMRASARERAIAEEAGMYGVSPVMDPSGKINVLATVAATTKAKDLRERLKAQTSMKDRQDFEVQSRAKMLGIDPNAPAQKPNGWSLSPSTVNAAPVEVPLERRVMEAENKARVDQAAAESRARAEASSQFVKRFAQGDNLALNGKAIGRAVRDEFTGQYGIMGADGVMQPIPEGAEPITATAMQKNVPSLSEFRKITDELTDSERSLRQIERYANSVGGLRQGLAGLADGFVSGFKTLVGSGKLSQQELARRMAEGNLQGLLGGNRLAVVGGGVMTEQDAQRIVNYLGGDIGALQNKEQVMQAMAQLYNDRYAQYENDILFYNAAIEDYYGSKGYKPRPFTDYNKLFGEPAVNGTLPVAEQPAADQPAKSAQRVRIKLEDL